MSKQFNYSKHQYWIGVLHEIIDLYSKYDNMLKNEVFYV